MTSQNNFFDSPAGSNNGASSSVLPKKKPWYKKWWGASLLALVFLILVFGIALVFYILHTAYLLNSGQISQQDLLNQTGTGLPQRQIVTYATTDDPSFGPVDAKVVIVEFSDFQCPFCQQAMPVVDKILADYGDKVLFIYRDFPLESIHPQAVVGALAGQCAHEQGKFWEMHDKIFTNQQQLSVDNLKIWAVQLGLNSIQFSDCLDSAKYFSEVEEDLQAGIAAGVRATPTFFINGQKVEGALPFSTFEQVILSELSK